MLTEKRLAETDRQTYMTKQVGILLSTFRDNVLVPFLWVNHSKNNVLNRRMRKYIRTNQVVGALKGLLL